MQKNEYKAAYAAYVDRLTLQLEENCRDLFAANSSVAEAARYSLMNGGKRVRGVLSLAVCEMLGGDGDNAAALGAAVEMLHCYSLIHDDLPCMDDADTRRGQPACHKKYGETTALLAGDALLTAAFAAIACAPLSAQQKADAAGILAQAAGPVGMVYGQELDLYFEHKEPTHDDLLKIHSHKTGDLINAAALFGAVAADRYAAEKEAVLAYSARLGLVFQIVDDILDVTATAEELGKPVGNDAQCGKITFATLDGVELCRKKSAELTEEACRALEDAYGDKAEFLICLAKDLVDRTY